jgi:O-antigen ligase
MILPPAIQRTERFSAWLVALLPLLFLLGRTLADVALVVVAFSFLARAAATHDWAWLRHPWERLALAWVAWLIVSGLLSGQVVDAAGNSFTQIRFVLFGVAAGYGHLREPWVRRRFFLALGAGVLLVGGDCLLQAATGFSITGRGLPEEYRLSGPFAQQQAGTYLAKNAFVLALPLLLAASRLGDRRRGGMALLMLILVGAIVLLTGERTAFLVFGLGLLLCLVALPVLRPFLLVGSVAVVLVLGAVVHLHPILIERYGAQTLDDLQDFADKRYGMILRTGLALWRTSPVTGIGLSQYPKRCPVPELDAIGPREVRCVSHPHNPWMEMLVEAGIVGLALWLGLVAAWLKVLARDRVVLVVGMAALLPFTWPLMTSMSIVATWNAILWWQAVAICLALTPSGRDRPSVPRR